MLIRFVTSLVAVVCMLMLLSGPVAAQKPNPKSIKNAEKHYKIALNYQNLGEYYKAADEYLKAYELYPDPEFFYNVAQVYRLAGDHQKSLFYYRKYIELDPKGRRVEQSREYITVLTHEIKNAGGEPKQPPFDPSTLPADSQGKKADVPRPPVDTTPQVKTTTSQNSEPDKIAGKPDDKQGKQNPGPAKLGPDGLPDSAVSAGHVRSNRTMSIAGIGVLGVGALSLALGIKYGLDARNLSDEIAGTTAWTEDNLDKFSQGESAEKKMFIATGIGAAAMIGGAALIIFSRGQAPASEKPAAVTITPLVSPHAAGIGIAGHL